MNARPAHGFTMIELIVTMTIAAILVMTGLPYFTRWMANSQVRTMSESLQNGLRLAQLEAAKRNDTVSLILTATDPPTCSSTASINGTNWAVCSGTSVIQSNPGKAGGKTATITSDFSSISFDGLGRSDLAALGKIDVLSAAGACETASVEGVRCLRVLVTPGGKVRMCDPMLPAGDSAACS
jgi:type IV fimbrial biogenesis protein FimT